MLVLVACEYSGAVRDALRRRGHDARSCDLLPTEAPGPHYQCDVLKLLDAEPWDALIAFPPCTYVCSSGLHWNKRRPERQKLTDAAVEFARKLLTCRVPRIGLENPVGCLSSRIRKPDQTIQPFDFGEDASKRTCLWLRNLPKLRPTKRHPGRRVEWPRGSGRYVERWSNQTDSGQNALSPDRDDDEGRRAHERSRTYQGIAEAMADQWFGPAAALPCQHCGRPIDHEPLGLFGCPNCHAGGPAAA